MIELIFACAIGVTCPEAKTFKTLDDCDRGRSSYSNIIAPGAVIATCRHRSIMPVTTGTTGTVIAPHAPIELHRLEFVFILPDDSSSSFFDKGRFSKSACDAYAKRSVDAYMAGPTAHTVRSMTYKCAPVAL